METLIFFIMLALAGAALVAYVEGKIPKGLFIFIIIAFIIISGYLGLQNPNFLS